MTQHRILRQVIEVAGCPPGTDAALRAQLGSVVQRHLLPVIERACDALDAPGRLWRAERLTLDLGPLPLGADALRPADEGWGRALAERLETCLAPALAEALQPTPVRQADLELLAQFIATGTVPWWADLDDHRLVPAALRRVLDDGPALRALGLDEVGPAWPRLVAGAGEAEAMRWLDALLPDAASRALWRPWRDALADALRATGVTAQALGQLPPLWWTLALPSAVRGRIAGQGVEPSALAQALVAALGLAPQALWPAWRRAFDQRLSSAGSSAEAASAMAAGRSVADAWWRALDGAPAAVALGGPLPGPADAALAWLRRQAAAQAEGSLMQRLLTALATAWPQLPARERDAAAARLTASAGAGRIIGPSHADLPEADLPDTEPALDSLPAPGWQALAALLQAADRAGRLPPALGEAWRAAAAAPQPQPAVAALARAAARLNQRADAAQAIDRRFADVDRMAVANAGLVLLWPFLPAFFSRLGWLADDHEADGRRAAAAPPGRRFASPQRATCAALLLHHLATGDAAPPAPDRPVAEHLLPLCKLLCGLAPEAPLAWPALAMAADASGDIPDDTLDGPAAWDAAMAESDLLLQAVIAQAPILRAMSVPAFRASFLLRAGQLGVRDDHWLLRVERTAYDMVRDRFPWGVSVLRLPWMNATLQVEW